MPPNSRQMSNLPPRVFRIGELGNVMPKDAIRTGFAQLDRELAGGGWELPGLIEILCERVGIGEASLLLKSFSKGVNEARAANALWILPVDGRLIPYAPKLADFGIDLSRLAIVQPNSIGDALWVAEQSLKSGACLGVLLYLDCTLGHSLALRRLQQAAVSGKAIAWLVRPLAAAAMPSPASLRIALNPQQDGSMRLDLLKRRGLPPGKSIVLTSRNLRGFGKTSERAKARLARYQPLFPSIQAELKCRTPSSGI